MPGYDFRKQPVSPPPGSDSEVVSSDGREQPRPVSLLSSMIAGQPTSPKRKTPPVTGGYTSGPSAPSTAPSTAFSSPRPQEEPISILRRGSVGSDGEPFFLPMARVLPASPERPEHPKSRRASTLKFAVNPRPDVFDRPPVAQHDGAEAEEDDNGTNTDKGYEEDSEDGFSSDDEPSFMVQAHQMALARAREAQLAAARTTSMSPPPARPAHPPPRRGRGHVRVDPAAADSPGRCSRHHSPPPETRPRSAPPGPRDGRAGSPVPEPMDVDDEEDDDDEDDDNEANDNAVADTDSEDNEAMSVSPGPVSEPPVAPASSIGAGVRNMIRRASEHLPSFRRGSFTVPVPEDSAIVLDDDDDASIASASGRIRLGRARSLGARAKPGILTFTQPDPIPSRPIACPTPPSRP